MEFLKENFFKIVLKVRNFSQFLVKLKKKFKKRQKQKLYI